ncbi:DUF3307 domain-containing protein [Candidatus Peregrinibacteria bacterium]|jgi:hypothetical protein|nr:DUF3307 domain-containing protein [Candidatus Peregrinibacteria bacterium]MBT7736229.1 DUF3307 domain-containing protein [Candidatus Peregrinibacteria bacterium]
MILSYLILAHLLGDFVLQPSSLVQWKMKSMKGNFVHVLIHFIVSNLILMPFILNGYEWLVLVILCISFAHFWIDEAKINYDLKHDIKVKPFLIDQMLHLLTILVAYFFINETAWTLPNTSFYQLYTNANIINFASLLVFITSAVDVYLFQKQREKTKKAKLKLKHPINSLLNRIITFSFLYALLMVLSYYASNHAEIIF